MILASLLILGLSTSPTAREDKSPAPEEFKGIVALSSDITLEDRWYHTLAASGVKVSTTHEVERGQVFKIFVFFLNATADTAGLSDIRTDIEILRPDGKPYTELKDIEAFTGSARGPSVYLAKQLLAVSFDPEDSLGKYKVRVVTRDVLAKVESVDDASIELVDAIDGEDFSGENAFKDALAWSTSAQAAREPQRLMHAFETIAGEGLLKDGPKGTPLRTFFRTAFDAHPFLYRSLGKLAADSGTDDVVRAEALRILVTGQTETKKRLDVVPKSVQTACKELRFDTPWDPLEDAITEPTHLDQLWETFFATGSFSAIERLTVVLDLDAEAYEGAAVVQAATRWSMNSIARRNELAHAYLSWIAAHEQTPAARKAEIAKILAD